MCCACAGTCCHTGDHSFCAAHSPSGVATTADSAEYIVTTGANLPTHDALQAAYEAGYSDGVLGRRSIRRWWRTKRGG